VVRGEAFGASRGIHWRVGSREVDLLPIPSYVVRLPLNAAPNVFIRRCCLTTEPEIADVQGGLIDLASMSGCRGEFDRQSICDS
jgi:hypothetical protein